jgi:photosystem II stability/assembly factor-like uncharacterized protein
MKNTLLILLLAVLFSVQTQAQFWQSINAPFSPTGSITGLVINAQNNIFAGTWGSGVYRSPDNGSSWVTVNNGLTEHFIQSLALTRSGVLFAAGYGGVFRSVDTGNTWVTLTNGLLNNVTNTIAFDTGNVVYIGNALGLYHSVDLGDHWLPDTSFVMTPSNSISCISIDASHHIFLGTTDGIYMSTDHGSTWQHKTLAINYPLIASIMIKDDGTMFATSCDNGSEKGEGIFRSTDGGGTWNGISSGITDSAVWSVFQFAGNELFAGTYHQGVFHSTDNGDSWQSLSSGLSNMLVYRFAKTSTGYIFAGTNNRLSRSVQSLTGIEPVPAEAAVPLNQNVPNPFSSSTRIQYNVTDAGPVNLVVYNMLGQKVATLADGYRGAGSHEVSFAPAVAGVYLCELTIGGRTETRRMVCSR